MRLSPVFQALEDRLRKTQDPDWRCSAIALLMAAKQRWREIDAVRAERYRQRTQMERRNDTNGTVITGDLHALEHECIKLMEPDITIPRGDLQKLAWQRVLKTKWGKDLLTAPFAKTRF